MMQAMLDHPSAAAQDLSCLRLCTSAGEALPEPLHRRWNDAFGVEVLDGIGSSEAYHIYISNRPGRVRPGSIGEVVPGYPPRWSTTMGTRSPDGQIGRLWVRGESAALMYWQDADASARTFAGGLVMSGDLVERDADGYFLYRGRADDLLKVGGIWVAPAEIERCLAAPPRRGRVRGGRGRTRRSDARLRLGGPQAWFGGDARERCRHSCASASRLTRSRARCASWPSCRGPARARSIEPALRRLAPTGDTGGRAGVTRFRASAGFTERWQHFDFSVDDGVATITLARPEKLGALTFDVYADLRDLLAELPHRGDARVLVITGSGRGFCSGGDVVEIIGALQSMQSGDLLEFTRMTGSVVRALRECPLPVIAAVNGIAAGAGAVIALASDIRLLARSARFAFLFTKVGLAGADMGSAYLLPRVIGFGRATELLLLGDTVDADRALEIGLATAVVDDDALAEAALTMARRLADGPALAYSTTKVLLTRELDMGLRRRARARRDDPGAAHGQPRPRRVSPRLDRGARARYGRGDEHPSTRSSPLPDLPAPVGYAHAVVAAPGRTVYLGGQTAQAPDGTIFGVTIVEQFDLAARNLVAALQAAGGQPDDLVSLQIFVTDLAAYRASHARSSGASGEPISAAATRPWRCSVSPSCSTRAPSSSWSASPSSRERDLRAPDRGASRAAGPQRDAGAGRPGADRERWRAGQGQPRAGRGALRARAGARGARSAVARSRRSTSAWSARAWRGTRPRPRRPSRSRDSGAHPILAAGRAGGGRRLDPAGRLG